MTNIWHEEAQSLLGRERTSGHGRMTGHRLTSTTGALLVLALSAAVPAVADAGSLLSGYGGPGQGNQAILGSALLNGRAGGGGSTGGGSTGGGSLTAGTGGGEGAVGSRASEARTGAAGGGPAPKSTGREKHINNSRVGAASGAGSHPYRGTSGSAASRAQVGGSQTLGFSGGDALYIFLAVGALGVTAAFTRRLARQPG